MATKKATKEEEVKAPESTETPAPEAEAKPRGKASGKKATVKEEEAGTEEPKKATTKKAAGKTKAKSLPKLDNAAFAHANLDFDLIEKHPDFRNCRSEGTPTEELEEGIAELGLENPLTVWRNTEGGTERFVLISGFRRYEAIRNLRTKTPGSFKEVPVSIFEGDVKEAYLHNLSENAQRLNPNAVEYGEAIVRMIDDLGMSQAEIARQMGMSPSWVSIAVKFAKGKDEGVTTQLRGAVQSGLVGFNMGRIVAKKEAKVQIAFVKACEKAKANGEPKPTEKDLDDLDPKPPKKVRQKSRALPDVLKQLEEYNRSDTSKLVESMKDLAKYLKEHPEAKEMVQDVMKLAHRYGEVKVLTWASGKEIDWKAARPPFEIQKDEDTENVGESVEPKAEAPEPAKVEPAAKPKAAGKKGGKKKAVVEAA